MHCSVVLRSTCVRFFQKANPELRLNLGPQKLGTVCCFVCYSTACDGAQAWGECTPQIHFRFSYFAVTRSTIHMFSLQPVWWNSATETLSYYRPMRWQTDFGNALAYGCVFIPFKEDRMSVAFMREVPNFLCQYSRNIFEEEDTRYGFKKSEVPPVRLVGVL